MGRIKPNEQNPQKRETIQRGYQNGPCRDASANRISGGEGGFVVNRERLSSYQSPVTCPCSAKGLVASHCRGAHAVKVAPSPTPPPICGVRTPCGVCTARDVRTPRAPHGVRNPNAAATAAAAAARGSWLAGGEAEVARVRVHGAVTLRSHAPRPGPRPLPSPCLLPLLSWAPRSEPPTSSGSPSPPMLCERRFRAIHLQEQTASQQPKRCPTWAPGVPSPPVCGLSIHDLVRGWGPWTSGLLGGRG